MSLINYVKRVWTTTDTVTSTRLQALEDAIEALDAAGKELVDSSTIRVSDLGNGQVSFDYIGGSSTTTTPTTPTTPPATSGNAIGVELLDATEATLGYDGVASPAIGWWNSATDSAITNGQADLSGTAQMAILLRTITVVPGEVYRIQTGADTSGTYVLGGDMQSNGAWVTGGQWSNPLSGGSYFDVTVPTGANGWKPTIQGVDGTSATIFSASVKRVS